MRGSTARIALLAFAAAAIVAAGAAAAGAHSTAPKIKNGGTLTIGLAEDPDALDPTVARTFVGRIVFLHMCQKLYDLNSKLQIVPQLAAALPTVSKDKLTYTIQIKKGIKFNDGTPLTGAAVKTTLERYLTYPGSVRKSEISPIQSVDASGQTVTLHLSQPYSPLTSQLADRAGMILSPKAIADEGTNFAQNPVCVGPFMFKDRVAGDHITLVKSPYYYDKKNVHLDSIVFKIITDPSARTQALLSGEIQVLDRAQGTDVPTLKSNKNVTLIKSTTIGYQGITINVGNQKGILKGYGPVSTALSKSADLRQAFSLALDRTTINKVVYQGLNTPGCFPISPVSPWFAATKGIPCNLHADDAAAKAAFAKAGVTGPVDVNLMIATDPVAARLGQVIQAMEKPIGFNVHLQPTEFVSSLNKADAGNFDAFAIGWSGRVDPDGNIYGFVATDGTLNEAGFSNNRLDYVLRGARKSITTKARTTLYHVALQIINDQAPLIYLYYPVDYFGVSSKVTGVQAYGDGLIRAYNAAFK